jgi:hypothetical protein
MPWAAPIGTGQGPRNPRGLRELRERAPEIPLIVDAGIGLPSQACQVGQITRTRANRGNIDSRVRHSELIPPFRSFPFLTLVRSA